MSFLQQLLSRGSRAKKDASAPSEVSGESLLQQTLQSVQNSEFMDTGVLLEQDHISIPLLGSAPAASHQRKLLALLAVGGIALGGLSGWVLQQSDLSAKQVAATGQSLMQAQRMAKSGTQALLGVPHAFLELKSSATVFGNNVRALAQGDPEVGIVAVKEDYQADVRAMLDVAERSEKNAKAVYAPEDVLLKVAGALRDVNPHSAALLDLSETVASMVMQGSVRRADLEAVSKMAMLTQRIGKSANEFQSLEGVNPEAVFLLGKDLNTFQEITQGLLSGNEELGLVGTENRQVREQLTTLLAQYEATRSDAEAILSKLQGLVSAREAQSAVIGDSEVLRTQLESLQTRLSGDAGISWGQMAALLGGVGIARVALLDSRQRQKQAEQQQREARLQEQEAKRINDANQAAILRLMNELQNLAEGD